MVSLRDGREGPLLAVHVHIAIVAVDFHVKSATVARAVDLELVVGDGRGAAPELRRRRVMDSVLVWSEHS